MTHTSTGENFDGSMVMAPSASHPLTIRGFGTTSATRICTTKRTGLRPNTERFSIDTGSPTIPHTLTINRDCQTDGSITIRATQEGGPTRVIGPPDRMTKTDGGGCVSVRHVW